MELEQRLQHSLHVAVAGMHLIDDQYLAEQAEQAQRLVLAVQHAEHRLVDRADAGGCYECALVVVGQPGGAARSRGLVALAGIAFFVAGPQHRRCEGFHQPLLTVGQGQARIGAEQALENLGNPPVHRVGRGHGRQADEEAVGQAAGHHAVRQHHGGLGLAGAGDVFEHDQGGLGRQRLVAGPGLQG